MYTDEGEAQLGYLPSCPPYWIQWKAGGAIMEKTELPLIHNSCMRGATPVLGVYFQVYRPSIHT